MCVCVCVCVCVCLCVFCFGFDYFVRVSFALVVLGFVFFSTAARELAGKNVSEMTYFMSSGT